MSTKSKLSLAAASLAVLMAANAHAGSAAAGCDQIQKLIQAGKSREQVAKELNVSMTRIDECTRPHKK